MVEVIYGSHKRKIMIKNRGVKLLMAGNAFWKMQKMIEVIAWDSNIPLDFIATAFQNEKLAKNLWGIPILY